MKTVTALAFFAALVAFALFPFSADLAVLLFCATGMLALLAGDYMRPVRSLRPRGDLVTFAAARLRPAPLGVAA